MMMMKSSFAAMHHRKGIRMSSKLDFTYGELPSVKTPSEISPSILGGMLKLSKKLALSAPFAKNAIFYDSVLSVDNSDDVTLCSLILQAARSPETQLSGPKYLSLSVNIIGERNLFNYEPNLSRAIERVKTGEFSGVFLEPAQGNGQLGGWDDERFKALNKACFESNTLFVIDETWCGLGRTGSLWAHTALGLEPDLLLMDFGPKVQLASMLISERFLKMYTFADIVDPLRSTEASMLLTQVSAKDFLYEVGRKSRYFKELLERKISKHDRVTSVHVFGLIITVHLNCDPLPIVHTCYDLGLKVVAGLFTSSIRLMPPTGVTEIEIDIAVAILERAIYDVI